MANEPTADTLNVPPFPPLKWDDFFWTCKDRIPAWDAFQQRGGAYGAVSDAPRAAATVSINVTPADRAQRSAPSPEQVRAYEFLKANDAAVTQAILKSLLAEYPGWIDGYGYDEEEAAELMPPVTDASDFHRLIGLGTVHILDVARDGVAYVGYEIGCTWDEEHGVGVMTHKDRVIDIGGADCSFRGHAATGDGGNPVGS